MGKFINQQVSAGELPKDITVNIISTRGEKNSQEPYSKNGNCKLWEYGNFKIENLIEEFNNFNSKFDLIVSNYTLRHLVDPLGTFLQMHDLLKEDGIMITDTFAFQVKNTDITPEFYLTSGVLISYLHDIGDEVLVGKGCDRSYPAIAVRKHGKDIKIPLNYNNYTYDNDANAYYQIFTSNTSLKIDAIDFVLQALDTSEGKRNIEGNKSLFKLFADALLLEIHENLVKEKTLLLDESALQENYKKIFNGKGCSFENYVKHTQQSVKSLNCTITSLEKLLEGVGNNFSYKYADYVLVDGSENDVVLNGVAHIYN